MSNILTRAARPIRLPSNDKAVLMALADMARDPDDADSPCQAWPPMHGRDGAIGLCDWTCLSERAVQRAVKALATAGLIARRQLSHGALYTLQLLASPVPQSGDCQSGDPQSGDCQTPSPAPQSPKAQQSTSKRKKTTSSSSTRERTAFAQRSPPAPAAILASALDLPALPSGASEQQWADYVEMRVAMGRADKKRAWTPTVARKAIEKLHTLAAAGNDPGAVLDQSVLNTWQGLFPVKDDQHGRRDDRSGRGGGAGDGRNRPVDGFTAALREAQARFSTNDDRGG